MSIPLFRVSLTGSTTVPFAGHCHNNGPDGARGRDDGDLLRRSGGAGALVARAGGVEAAPGGGTGGAAGDEGAVALGGAVAADGAGDAGGGNAAGAVDCGTASRGRVSVGADGLTATTPTTAESPSGG